MIVYHSSFLLIRLDRSNRWDKLIRIRSCNQGRMQPAQLGYLAPQTSYSFRRSGVAETLWLQVQAEEILSAGPWAPPPLTPSPWKSNRSALIELAGCDFIVWSGG
jgi:hypothetical protein